jgi:hypothetical protein
VAVVVVVVLIEPVIVIDTVQKVAEDAADH